MIFPAPPSTTSRWIGRRILFRIGPLAAPSYTVMLYFGFVAGAAVGAWVAASAGLDAVRFALAAVVLLIPALIGGRLWYAVEHPRRFWAAPMSLLRTQDGGAGLYGGLVLSFAVSAPVLRAADLDFWRWWDGGAVIMLIGMMVTRFGCLMNGCCYGRETGGPFGMWLPDHAGRWRRRVPTQLLESAWSGLILAAELAARPHLPAGGLFLTAAIAYGVGRIVLQLLRGDAAEGGSSTRVNVAFSGLLILLAAATLASRAGA